MARKKCDNLGASSNTGGPFEFPAYRTWTGEVGIALNIDSNSADHEDGSETTDSRVSASIEGNGTFVVFTYPKSREAGTPRDATLINDRSGSC